MPQRNLKEQIVEGGFRILYEKGYHAASVNDIVAAARVPKGSFYNHFESKEALALEVAGRYGDSFHIGRLPTGEGPPLERLRAHFESVAGQTIERGVEYGCLFGNFSTELAGHSTAICELVATAFDEWSDAVATVLKQAQAAGEVDAALDADAFGRYLVDGFEGALARAKVTGSRAPLDSFITTTFDVVLAA
jgi:TetR/AcrR family transcriptional repressor of nem operon